MAYEGEVVRLVEGQIEADGEMLGRAFFDNSMAVYMLPDAEQRLEPLTFLFTAISRDCFFRGEVHTTAAVIGSAAWFAPDSPPLTREAIQAAHFNGLPHRMGAEPFQRLMVMKDHFDGLRARDVPEPHWYLSTLGVDPPRQGQGVGSALLRPVLARADAAGLPCYLETDKARNVPFYQKHGFEVVEEGVLPGDGGYRYWTMKRPARR